MMDKKNLFSNRSPLSSSSSSTLLSSRSRGPSLQLTLTLSALLLLIFSFLTKLSFTLSQKPSPSWLWWSASAPPTRSAPEHFETDIGSRFTQPYRDHPSPLTHSFANETCRTASSATLPSLLNADLDRLPLALRAYARFHASAIACLAEVDAGNIDADGEEGAKKEDKGKRRTRRAWWGGRQRKRQRRRGCNERVRLLVWKGELGFIGGFGDRWKGLQFILALAIATQSVFLIEWPHQAQTPYDLSAALHPTYIDWRLQPFIVKALSAVKDDRQIAVKLQRDPDGIAIGRPYSFSNPFASQQQQHDRLEANVSDFNAVLATYDVVFVRNTFLAGDDIVRLARNQHHARRFDGLTHLDYIPIQRVLTRFMFRPSPAVAFLARQRSFPHGVPYIGVHMRTGIDVLETSDRRFRQVSDVAVHDTLIGTVVSCIRRHIGTYISSGDSSNTKKMRVFVTSDSKMLKQRFVEYAQRNGHDNEVIIVNTNLRFVWHMDRQRSDLFENYDEHCLAFLDIFADAYALSEAKSIVYLPSNFPEAAIGFGNVRAWHKLQGNGLTPLDEQECFPANLSTIAS